MFTTSPTDAYKTAVNLMQKAEKFLKHGGYPDDAIAAYQAAINAYKHLKNITHDDRRKLAHCYFGIANSLQAIHDEKRPEDFETRCRHPDFFENIKQAIYQIDTIPFDEQADKDCKDVMFYFGEISIHQYYFHIPDEAVMDDNLLRVTGKYGFKRTAIELKKELTRLLP